MGMIGQLLASTAALTPAYAERLLVGIEPRQFARFARVGDVAIRSNHPAWALGHLCTYPPRVMELLGRPQGDAAVPANYDALFKNGAECRDDPDGTIYPPMEEITRKFFGGYQQAVAAIAEARDEQLVAPNPVEGRMREMFPQLGSMLAFYVNGHPQMHLGQISAWRRAAGLPPA